MVDLKQIQNQAVLVRLDLDVPIHEGKVSNSFRLEADLPTLRLLSGARKTLIIGHLGRPQHQEPSASLRPVGEWLEGRLNQKITFIDQLGGIEKWQQSQSPIGLLENLRFDEGESGLSEAFAQRLAQGFEAYVYEAFAAYNPAASLNLLPRLLPTYTGVQFDREVENLSRVRNQAEHPAILILSGAKDDKAKFIDLLRPLFDQILVGGKLASLWKTQVSERVVVAPLTPDGLDIAPPGIKTFVEAIQTAKTVVFNGPVGRFEDSVHAVGTRAVLEAILTSNAFSLIGGGDTLAAIPALGLDYAGFDFVSTGGGAMLEYLVSGTHPLLEIIRQTSVR